MHGTLDETLERVGGREMEKTLEIVYQPQALFKVQAVTRCSSSIPGTYRKWAWLPLQLFKCKQLYPQWPLQYYISTVDYIVLYSVCIVSFPHQFLVLCAEKLVW